MVVQCGETLAIKRLIEHGESPDKPVYTRMEVFAIQSLLSRIHGDEWVSNDVFHEWPCMNRPKDKAKRLGFWVTEYDEFIS